MPVFTKKIAEELFADLWSRLLGEFGLGEQLKENGITLFFRISDPDMVMFVDENGPLFGTKAANKTPMITMQMKGDIAHKFWLRGLNLPKAMAFGQIVVKGPVHKIFELLPLMEPAQDVYPEYCRKYNLPIKKWTKEEAENA